MSSKWTRRGVQDEIRDVSSTETSLDLLRSHGLIDDGGFFSIATGERAALNITAVWSAVRYLADTIAMLPISVVERRDDASRIKHHDHPVAEFFRSPCPEFPQYTVMQSLLASANLHGNGYGLIERDRSGDPIGLRIQDARTAIVRHLDDTALFPKLLVYEFPASGGRGTYRFAANDVLHIRSFVTRGLYGISPIRCAARSIAISTAGENYAGHLYAGGAKPAGVVQTPNAMSDQAYKRFKDSLERVLDRLRVDPGSVSGAPLILEEGATFSPWGMTAEDVQLLATRRFQVEEIARLFRVPPHKIGSLEKSSFNNIEQQNIDAVTDSLQPWIVQIEQEFSRKLISPAERGTFRAHIDLKGILRGDFKSRTDGYRNLSSIGAISADEIRTLEDMNPLGDEMGARPRVLVNTMPAPDGDQADRHVEKIVSSAASPGEPAKPAEAGEDPDPENPADPDAE